MPRGGYFLVPFGFSAIMLASIVCFPADFGTSRLFGGNVLHVMPDSGYRLLFGISTARIYATFAVSKSVFFAPGIVTFFFAQVVIGKTFVYGMLYAVFALFLLGLIPLMFGLPDIGNPLYVIMLMIPFLLATSFFGLTASLFFTDSDAPLLMIAFFSVGLIFLSGVSYPMELMPWYWKLVHYLIPAAPATMAYVKLNSMGASMSEIQPEYIILWVQCIFYFVTACLVYRYNIRKAVAKGTSLVITDDFSSHKS